MTAISYEDDPRPVFDGDWATASGLEKGLHADRVKKWKARQSATANTGPGGAPTRSVEPEVERDRTLALRTARSIAKNPTARDADRLAAASLLARIEEVQSTAKPPSIAALEALSTEELEALVVAHL